MTLRASFAAVAAVLALAPAALAEGLEVRDAYARASSPAAMSGAAFMEIVNTGGTDDRLVSAASDIAARVELHTHVMEGDVMRMVHVEEGFELPAGETVVLERGGRHVMFMGLAGPMEHGETVAVTLTFEQAGDMVVEIPVDLERQD
ncbi:MAG: copper chaperone PCu(A)C [Paracoccaceae bacterium]|jgi:copper(I)-binding protein|nr:copper chaperone PCu(A)C [Paracoccaceae bacterium]